MEEQIFSSNIDSILSKYEVTKMFSIIRMVVRALSIDDDQWKAEKNWTDQ